MSSVYWHEFNTNNNFEFIFYFVFKSMLDHSSHIFNLLIYKKKSRIGTSINISTKKKNFFDSESKDSKNIIINSIMCSKLLSDFQLYFASRNGSVDSPWYYYAEIIYNEFYSSSKKLSVLMAANAMWKQNLTPCPLNPLLP